MFSNMAEIIPVIDEGRNAMKNRTALESIRTHCRWCTLDQAYEIRICQSQEICPVWPFRLEKLPAQGHRSALKAIRARCLACVGRSCKEVSECKTECALNQYRFGKRINVSEAYREVARNRAKLNPLFQKGTTERPIQTSRAEG
jgi:hypothetical protein